MPHFQWSGVDILGNTRRGRQFARSKKELDAVLFKRQIALLKSKPTRTFSLFSPILLQHNIQTFRQLAELVGSGVLLPEALTIVAGQTEQPKLASVLHTVAVAVHEGKTFAHALAQYPHIFDRLTIQMVHVGHESGNVAIALSALADYLDRTQTFQKKVRAAALMPAITFGFFVVISLVIFIVVMPKFAAVFSSLKSELPPLTKTMMRISDFLHSSRALVWAGLLAMGLFALKKYRTTKQGSVLFDTIFLRLPYIGMLTVQTSLAYFLHALSMVLTGGMQAVPALDTARHTVRNSVLRKQLGELVHDVAAGSSLSEAMLQDPGQLFGADVVSLIKVGEASGDLAALVKKASGLYQERVDRSLSFVTTMVQPLLMIILGLLITLLIFAVYLPIFNLSQVI